MMAAHEGPPYTHTSVIAYRTSNSFLLNVFRNLCYSASAFDPWARELMARV